MSCFSKGWVMTPFQLLQKGRELYVTVDCKGNVVIKYAKRKGKSCEFYQ